jgi:hypothetical protein
MSNISPSDHQIEMETKMFDLINAAAFEALVNGSSLAAIGTLTIVGILCAASLIGTFGGAE